MITSNSGKSWVWQVEALGTWLDNREHVAQNLQNQLHVLREEGFVDPKLPVKRRIDAFYSTCAPAALHGAGERTYTQILGRICDMALRRNVESRIHQTVQGGLTEQHGVQTPSPWQTGTRELS